MRQMVKDGITIPDQLYGLVRSMADVEVFNERNPDATPEQRSEYLIDLAMEHSGYALDQEFSAFRDRAWELIDLAGSVAVIEQDSAKRWLKIVHEVTKACNVAEVLGIFTVMLAEFGRQPELVAEIRRRNERIFEE